MSVEFTVQSSSVNFQVSGNQNVFAISTQNLEFEVSQDPATIQFSIQNQSLNFATTNNQVDFEVIAPGIAFDVSQIGPQGPIGPAGPAGPPGPEGAPITPTVYQNQASINIASAAGWSVALIENTDIQSTINLPNTPTFGQIFTAIDGNMKASQFPITINAGENSINNPNGVATFYIIGQNGGRITFMWTGSAWSLFG